MNVLASALAGVYEPPRCAGTHQVGVRALQGERAGVHTEDPHHSVAHAFDRGQFGEMAGLGAREVGRNEIAHGLVYRVEHCRSARVPSDGRARRGVRYSGRARLEWNADRPPPDKNRCC